MTKVRPASRFHRTIKKMKRFSGVADLSPSLPHLNFLNGMEQVWGIYQGDQDEETVLFSSDAFIGYDGLSKGFLRIPYSALTAVNFPLPAESPRVF